MNKRFSTLLAAALVAGSFCSTFAQLDNRDIEWKNAKTNRAYYLAGKHGDITANTYGETLQALLSESVDKKNHIGATAINENNPVVEGQWFVEKNAQGLYSFKDASGKYLAFAEKDGAYDVVTNAENANKSTALRYFKLTEEKQLQLQNVDGALYLGVAETGTNAWKLTVAAKDVSTGNSRVFIKKDLFLYEAYDTPVTPAAFRDKEGDNFSFSFDETLQGDTTFTKNQISVVTVGSDGAAYLMVEGKAENEEDGTFTSNTSDKFKAAKFIYVTKNTFENNVNDEPMTGFRYDVISGKDYNKAVKENKLDADNIKFYIYTSLNQEGYILKQKGINGDQKNTEVWVSDVDAKNQLSYVATRETNVNASPMTITVGLGTRVPASEIANAKTKVVNVLAANENGVFAKALGLEDVDLTTDANVDPKLYEKKSAAMLNYPAGQWLVTAGSKDNTVALVNVQNLKKIDNIAFYSTDKDGVYKVKATDSALNGETIKLETANYSKENGYFHAANVAGQTYTIATMVQTLVGGEYVDVYLKADAKNNVVFGTPFENKATEWTLTRDAEANEIKTTYKYYEGTSLKESKNEVIRTNYGYKISDEDKYIANSYGLSETAPTYSFYLRQVAKDSYVIAYSESDPKGKDFKSYAALKKTDSDVNDYKLTDAEDNLLANATRFTIESALPMVSLKADSKHMTFEAVKSLGFIASNKDNAVIAKEAAALWVDSVNVEGNVMPKFFISYAGKMMTTADKVIELATTAYENDEITEKELDAIKAGAEYESAKRIMFVDAKRVAGEDTLVVAGEKATGEDIDAFKFTIFENEDGNYQLMVDGELVYVRDGNLVYGDATEAEAFVIEATSAPTANEGIAASEVKVIAGEGQVTIANAAGKKVVVSNILGQIVANTFIASDNATIAAPAGVVVVAVEGEAAVKAIVK